MLVLLLVLLELLVLLLLLLVLLLPSSFFTNFSFRRLFAFKGDGPSALTSAVDLRENLGSLGTAVALLMLLIPTEFIVLQFRMTRQMQVGLVF